VDYDAACNKGIVRIHTLGMQGGVIKEPPLTPPYQGWGSSFLRKQESSIFNRELCESSQQEEVRWGS